jgi:hypothetical protein
MRSGMRRYCHGQQGMQQYSVLFWQPLHLTTAAAPLFVVHAYTTMLTCLLLLLLLLLQVWLCLPAAADKPSHLLHVHRAR